jgi:energy-converting hydrogenase Eha subunit B
VPTIYLGGVGRADVKRLLEKRRHPDLKFVVSNDLEAGPILKRTSDSYYIGTCHTGAGGALGAMLVFLGRQRCHTFGRRAHINAAEVQELLNAGIRAFGLSVDQIPEVVPVLVDAILAYQPEGDAS